MVIQHLFCNVSKNGRFHKINSGHGYILKGLKHLIFCNTSNNFSIFNETIPEISVTCVTISSKEQFHDENKTYNFLKYLRHSKYEWMSQNWSKQKLWNIYMLMRFHVRNFWEKITFYSFILFILINIQSLISDKHFEWPMRRHARNFLGKNHFSTF